MKAILILPEMPKNCLSCPIGKDKSIPLETWVYCEPIKKGIFDDGTENRPDFCPLRSLPEMVQEKEYRNDLGMIVTCRDYNKGWNDALKTIEGSEEDA